MGERDGRSKECALHGYHTICEGAYANRLHMMKIILGMIAYHEIASSYDVNDFIEDRQPPSSSHSSDADLDGTYVLRFFPWRSNGFDRDGNNIQITLELQPWHIV